MKAVKTITVFSLLLFFVTKVFSAPRNFLINEFNAKNGVKSFLPINEWRHKYVEKVHKELEQLSPEVKKELISEADIENKSEWPSLLATKYLEFVKTGDRNHYENDFFHRRVRLEKLVIGELLTNSSKYMNQIVNGLWLMLEESTWTVPAHLGFQKAGLGLPDATEPVIDLFAAESSNHIAYSRLLLSDKLDKVHHMINKRIDYVLNRRIVDPYLTHNYGWMSGTNNWNTWINANVLRTILFTTNDEKKRNDIVVKIVNSVEHFLNNYPNDGGCDEGPNYWNAAGGKLIELIDLLSSVSNGQMNWSKNQLIHDIGSYTYKLYIGDGRFVNFADAPAQAVIDYSRIMKYGNYFNDENLRQFASYLDNVYNSLEKNNSISRQLAVGPDLRAFGVIDVISSFKNTKPVPRLVSESWLPNLQVMTMREKEGSTNGLFFGVKAGNNGESHNHNDVGNFILYVNAKPGLIDVGPPEYTSATFGAHRYDIWNLQSQWHNCPSINGIDQHDGRQYTAHNVNYTKTANGGEFVADIAGAYPKEAAVKSWERKFIYNRNPNSLAIHESYELSEWKNPFVIHFITVLSESEHKSGELILKKDNTTLVMQYDYNLFDVKVEQRIIKDNNLLKVWGQHMNRVNLVAKQKNLKSSFTVTFKST